MNCVFIAVGSMDDSRHILPPISVCDCDFLGHISLQDFGIMAQTFQHMTFLHYNEQFSVVRYDEICNSITAFIIGYIVVHIIHQKLQLGTSVEGPRRDSVSDVILIM